MPARDHPRAGAHGLQLRARRHGVRVPDDGDCPHALLEQGSDGQHDGSVGEFAVQSVGQPDGQPGEPAVSAEPVRTGRLEFGGWLAQELLVRAARAGDIAAGVGARGREPVHDGDVQGHAHPEAEHAAEQADLVRFGARSSRLVRHAVRGQ
uniref:(northern house mosquito) hypothetical protein n=1 Tax=Culex pipiens TaxID=7175 RepID=A0A8D8AJA2_CULPI